MVALILAACLHCTMPISVIDQSDDPILGLENDGDPIPDPEVKPEPKKRKPPKKETRPKRRRKRSVWV